MSANITDATEANWVIVCKDDGAFHAVTSYDVGQQFTTVLPCEFFPMTEQGEIDARARVEALGGVWPGDEDEVA